MNMSRRTVLISEWRDRLAHCQAEIAAAERDGKPRIRGWVQRAYARVLRFLLAQYGRTETNDSWPAEALTERPNRNEAPSATLLIDVPVASSRPKDHEHIRATLERVHSLVPEIARGPMVAGAVPNSLVVAATFRVRRIARSACRWLDRRGIQGRVVSYGQVWKIEVMARDLGRALHELDLLGAQSEDHLAAAGRIAALSEKATALAMIVAVCASLFAIAWLAPPAVAIAISLFFPVVLWVVLFDVFRIGESGVPKRSTPRQPDQNGPQALNATELDRTEYLECRRKRIIQTGGAYLLLLASTLGFAIGILLTICRRHL